jgi:choline monooxygenase
LVIDPDGVAVVLSHPLDGESTRLDLHLYFLGDAATDEAHAATREHRAKEWQVILEQDLPYVTGVQKNATWRDTAGIRTRFSPYWEHSVRDFQRVVINTILDDREA